MSESEFISIGPEDGKKFDRLMKERPALVKFYRPGCPACDAMADEWAGLESMMSELQEHGANIIEVHESAIPNIESSCARGIEGVPTIMIVNIGGDMRHEYEGAREKEAFLKEYRKHFSKKMRGGARKPKGRRATCKARCIARAKRRCTKSCGRVTRRKPGRGRTKKKSVRKSRKPKRGKRRGTRKIPKKRKRSARKGGAPSVPMTRMAPDALFGLIEAGIKTIGNTKIIDTNGYLALMVYEYRSGGLVSMAPPPSVCNKCSDFDKDHVIEGDELNSNFHSRLLPEFEQPDAGLEDIDENDLTEEQKKMEKQKININKAIPYEPMLLTPEQFKKVYGAEKPSSGGRRRRR